MDRVIKIGMVGGGADSWVAQFHRAAIKATNRAKLVSGAFATMRIKSRECGEILEIDPKRTYGTYRDMMRKEARISAEDRMDCVSIVTPNNMHYPITMAAIDQGFDVICEKTMTTSMDEALNLKRKLEFMNREFCLTHTYTGYPMVKEAKKLISKGKIGNIRRVVVEYPQGWLSTRKETAGQKQAGWRTDPRRAGISGAIAHLGSHCANLAEYITGLEITEVCADLHTFIAGRPLDDDGSVLLRFNNGARGVLWSSQIAAGEKNGLSIRVYGDVAGMEWRHDDAEKLILRPIDKPAKTITAEPPTFPAPKAEPIWMPQKAGKGYLRALTSIYNNFFDELIPILDGEKVKTPSDYPRVSDGIRVMSFIDAVVRSSKSTEKWEELRFEDDYPDYD